MDRTLRTSNNPHSAADTGCEAVSRVPLWQQRHDRRGDGHHPSEGTVPDLQREVLRRRSRRGIGAFSLSSSCCVTVQNLGAGLKPVDPPKVTSARRTRDCIMTLALASTLL